jgi:phosphoglycolate phosphatase-like HAD superfamily hydrolase
MADADHDAVLFDLDGVLVDSRAAITGCINHALVEHEFAARPPERFIGPSLADAFAELTNHPGGTRRAVELRLKIAMIQCNL